MRRAERDALGIAWGSRSPWEFGERGKKKTPKAEGERSGRGEPTLQLCTQETQYDEKEGARYPFI